MRPNPFHARQAWVCGNTHTLVQYETISFWRACIAEVIEIRDKRGERMAWMHLFHESDVTVVREFFVPPWNRGRGYGTELEELARSQAEYRDRNVVRFTLDEADALPRNRAIAVGFLEHRGYTWRWEQSTRPNLAGFAERRVKDDV
jgi:predicted GNAT family acetyltransferase